MNKTHMLLDYLFDLKGRICDLVSETAPEDFNRPDLLMSREEILELLVSLNKSGFICFYSQSLLVRTIITKVSDLDYEWYVALTELGGQEWERVFQPNWENYVSINCSLLHDVPLSKVVIECGNKELILDVTKTLISKIVTDTVSDIEILQPWRPVYWKSISCGYMISFVMKEESIDELSLIQHKTNWRLMPNQ
jgi:hypothetical protein